LNSAEHDLRGRISHLLQSIEDDTSRSNEVFHYLWIMTCVRRGLMRVVREFSTLEARHVVLEEIRNGRQRLVAKPVGLDPEIETLAVEALARILGEIKLAG
jgi:hypothetical protein